MVPVDGTMKVFEFCLNVAHLQFRILWRIKEFYEFSEKTKNLINFISWGTLDHRSTMGLFWSSHTILLRFAACVALPNIKMYNIS